MRSASLALLTGLTVFVSRPVQSQEVVSLQQGVRIRVQGQSGGNTVGNFVAMDADSLRFAPVHNAERGVPVAAIKEIDVSNGRSHGRGLLMGAAIGSGVGLVGGALLGAASWSKPRTDAGGWGCLFVCSRGASAWLGAAVFGTVGIVVGSTVGVASGSEVWEPVFTKSH